MNRVLHDDKNGCEMNSEEYLIARGWQEPQYDDGPWTHPHHMVDDRARLFDLAEAVEAQLAEDRAILAFVMARTIVCAMWPNGRELTIDLTEATIVCAPKEPR